MPTGEDAARRILKDVQSPLEPQARQADAVIAAHALLERLGFPNHDVDELLEVARFLTEGDDR